MEILSNKLLATAFEASLGCMTVTAYAKRRQQGNRDSYRAPKSHKIRAPTLWSGRKAKHGFIVMARFHVVLRCWRELFMLYKDYMSTVGEPAFSFRSV